jgi:hypothetical protein
MASRLKPLLMEGSFGWEAGLGCLFSLALQDYNPARPLRGSLFTPKFWALPYLLLEAPQADTRV